MAFQTAIFALALAVSAFLTPQAGLARQIGTATDNSMKIVLVRGGSGCEASCPEWIYAQGDITRQTPAAFAKLFSTLGKRRPPVLIHSGGGNVDAAVQLGNLIRKHGFDVAVGRTRFLGCAPRDTCAEAEAKKGFRGVPEESGISLCSSACVLVLAAGKQRILLSRAVVGVHQIQINRSEQTIRHYRIYYRTVGGRREEIRRELIDTTKLPAKQFSPEKDGPIYGRLKTYVRRMGVEPALIDLFHQAKYEGMHWLLESELSRTKLVTARQSATKFVGLPDAATQPAGSTHQSAVLGPSNVVTPRSSVPATNHFVSASAHGQADGQPARIDLHFGYVLERPASGVAIYFAYAGQPIPQRRVQLEIRFDDGRVIRQAGVANDDNFVPMQLRLPKSDLCRLYKGEPVSFEMNIWPEREGDSRVIRFEKAQLAFRTPRTADPCASPPQNDTRPPVHPVLQTLGRAEIDLGQQDGRRIALNIEFEWNRPGNLAELSMIPNINGRNLRGGVPSALLETEDGRAFLALRPQNATPFAPLITSIPMADFCRMYKGSSVAVAFDRAGEGGEPTLALRRVAAALMLPRTPLAENACAALP